MAVWFGLAFRRCGMGRLAPGVFPWGLGDEWPEARGLLETGACLEKDDEKWWKS